MLQRRFGSLNYILKLPSAGLECTTNKPSRGGERGESAFPQQQPIFTRSKLSLKSSLLLEAASTSSASRFLISGRRNTRRISLLWHRNTELVAHGSHITLFRRMVSTLDVLIRRGIHGSEMIEAIAQKSATATGFSFSRGDSELMTSRGKCFATTGTEKARMTRAGHSLTQSIRQLKISSSTITMCAMKKWQRCILSLAKRQDPGLC